MQTTQREEYIEALDIIGFKWSMPSDTECNISISPKENIQELNRIHFDWTTLKVNMHFNNDHYLEKQFTYLKKFIEEHGILELWPQEVGLGD